MHALEEQRGATTRGGREEEKRGRSGKREGSLRAVRERRVDALAPSQRAQSIRDGWDQHH